MPQPSDTILSASLYEPSESRVGSLMKPGMLARIRENSRPDPPKSKYIVKIDIKEVEDVEPQSCLVSKQHRVAHHFVGHLQQMRNIA